MPTEEMPECCTEDHLEYLDDLRESGKTNMYGASLYLKNEFSELKKKEDAKAVLMYWMHTFTERHPQN